MKKRDAVLFPKEQKMMLQLGENISLAMKPRKVSQDLLANRTGLSKPMFKRIASGEASVPIGHYLSVLTSLGLSNDLGKVALDDELGHKLQYIELLRK